MAQVLEVWSETTAPKMDYESLLRAQPNEKASEEENEAAATAFQEEPSPDASEETSPAPAKPAAKRRPTPKVGMMEMSSQFSPSIHAWHSTSIALLIPFHLQFH